MGLRPWAASRWLWWTIPVLGAGLYAAVFYSDLLWGGRVYVYRDAYTLFLTSDHVARTLSTWQWPPLWDPFTGLGRPFAADPFAGIYYPPNWLLRALPEWMGFGAAIALHHGLAALGAYALLRFHRLARVSAALGGVLFAFGGALVSLDNMLNGLQAATWLPWSMLAFEAWNDQRSRPALAALSLALSLGLLGALPEFVLFTNLLLAARAVDRAQSGGPPLWRSAAVLAAANVLAVGVCAVLLLPFAEYVAQSSRAEGLSLREALNYSQTALGWLAFILPRRFVDAHGAFHETAGLWEGLTRAPLLLSLYVGVGGFVTALAYTRLSRFQRYWWSAVTAGALLLALGQHLPGYEWVLARVAFLRMVRYPEKFLLIAHAMIAAAAAIGLDAAWRDPRGFRRLLYVTAPSALLALAASQFHAWAPIETRYLAGDLGVLVGLLLLLSLLAFAGFAWPRAACAAIVVLAGLDLLRVNRRLLPTLTWEDIRRAPPALRLMHAGDDPLRLYGDLLGRPPVAAFPDAFIQEKNLLLGQTAGYHLAGNLNTPAPINLADQERLARLIERAPRDRTPAILGAFNVAYVTAARALDRPGFTRLHEPANPLDAFVYAVEPHGPRAFVAARVRGVATDDDAVNHLLRADPRAEVAVAAGTIPANLPPTSTGTVRLESYQPTRVELTAQMDTPGLVVLADTFYPGWSAAVSGVAVPIVRANYFARGVYVGSGTHRIVFEYAPPSRRLGTLLSLVSLGTVLVIAVKRTR